MSTLRFNELEPKRAGRTKPLSTILGIGALVGALALGTTFAANINLNGENNVEFGQGVVTTAACDSTINVAPVSTFVNASPSASPAARFELGSIVFSGIDTTACDGKTFTIKAFGDTGGALVLVNGTVDEILVSLSTGAFTEAVNETGVTVANNQNGLGFTITLDSLYSPIAADQVYKITIESKDSVVAAPISYSVGDTGPGGGTVFYVSSTDFTMAEAPCGTGCRYLEWAPIGWSVSGDNGDPSFAWSSDSDETHSVGETGTAIGTGYSNTRKMLSANSPYMGDASGAAFRANAYRGGEKSDWFLPSLDELAAASVYARANLVGGFHPESFYHVSSEWIVNSETTRGYAYQVFSGQPGEGYKYIERRTRPIRAF
jgi:hypothetical protein